MANIAEIRSVEERVANIEGVLSQMNIRMGNVETLLRWLLGIVLGTWITTMMTILLKM